MTTIRLALAQTRQSADRQGNRAAILAALDEAASQGVQLLCFPETQTVGHRVDIATPDTPVPDGWLDDLHREVADRCRQEGMACVLGAETPASQPRVKSFNTALVIGPTGHVPHGRGHGRCLGRHGDAAVRRHGEAGGIRRTFVADLLRRRAIDEPHLCSRVSACFPE
jgi:hypothetical protein